MSKQQVNIILKRGIMFHSNECDRDYVNLYDPLSDSHITAVPSTVPSISSCEVTAEIDAPQAASIKYYFQDTRSISAAWNMELTHCCTWACRQCYQSTTRHESWQKNPFAISGEWNRIISYLAERKPSELSLTGGEVMLFKALPDVLRALRMACPEMPLRILLSGMALWRRRDFKNLLPLLVEYGVLAKIPIYSCYEQTHDWVTRSPGSLSDIVVLIGELQKAGVPIHVSYLILRPTAHEAHATVKYLHSLVGESFSVSTLAYPRRHGYDNFAQSPYLLEPAQMQSLLSTLEFAALPVEYLSFQPQCAAGCRFPVVLPSCDVMGCTLCEKSHCGNAINNPKSLEQADRWMPAGRSMAGKCEECTASAICKRCLAFSDGDEWPESYCAIVHMCLELVIRRIEKALADGMQFVHPEAWDSWLRLRGRIICSETEQEAISCP